LEGAVRREGTTLSDDVEVIECSGCGRLHEVSASKTSMECECGEVLGDSDPAAGEAVPAAAGQAEGPSPGLLGRVRKSWRLFSVLSIVLIAAVLLLVFLRPPDLTFGELKLTGRGGLAATSSRIDVEACLRILEDNARSGEHLAAAESLLQLQQKELLVKRLSAMALRLELVSRTLIIRTLGQMGDDRALPVLESLFKDDDGSIVQLAVGAATQIDSASAESVLRRHFANPTWAREMLPAVAMVDNDTAARMVGSCLKRPELRVVAIKEIRLGKMKRCVKDLIEIASDQSVFESDRVKAIEALGTFQSRAVRRALADLLDDSKVGWKARQLLDDQGRL